MAVATAEVLAEYGLVQPDHGAVDSVHLVAAIARLCGVDGLDQSAATRQMIDEIGPADHYIFALCDGLGMNLIRRLPRDAFLVKNLRRPINAVCPSTTACALTCVATANWPAQHGITGWFTYLAERDLSITTLPFVERFSGKPLTQIGLNVEDVLPVPAYHPRMSYRPMTHLPSGILNTDYANYSRGRTAAIGYQSIAQAVDQIIGEISAATSRSYTHLYIPDIDTACHHHGIQDDGVIKLVMRIDQELARLHEAVQGRARIIVSADHGLIDVPVSNHMSLFFDNPLMKLLVVPPSGDARLPVFHVQPGKAVEFVEAFDERFGRNMKLLRTADAEKMRLFGPAEMSTIARKRFGDFVGIAITNSTLHYVPPAAPGTVPTPSKTIYIAQHAGLSRDEMEIPLIIA